MLHYQLNYWGTELSKGCSLPEIAESFLVRNKTCTSYAKILDANDDLIVLPAFRQHFFNAKENQQTTKKQSNCNIIIAGRKNGSAFRKFCSTTQE